MLGKVLSCLNPQAPAFAPDTISVLDRKILLRMRDLPEASTIPKELVKHSYIRKCYWFNIISSKSSKSSFWSNKRLLRFRVYNKGVSD